MAELAPPGDRGRLVIADKVVERIASRAAGDVEAVTENRSGWSKVVGRSLPTPTAKVAGGRVRVGVDVAAAWPAPLGDLAIRVRDHVSERVETLTGMPVVAVDVTVADVVHVDAQTRRVR